MPEIKEKVNPKTLAFRGPILKVNVSINSILAEIFLERGEPRPEEIALNALIDTGSAFTIIKQGKIDKLNLNPVSYQHVIGVNDSKSVKQPVYRVGVSFLGIDFFDVQAIVQPLNFPNVTCLIGRDLLYRCNFTYNGKIGEFSIRY